MCRVKHISLSRGGTVSPHGRLGPWEAWGSCTKADTPMGTAEEYRHVAWDCLKLADASSNPQTHASLLNLSQYWVRLAEEAERNRQYKLSGYRAKAWECASRAQSINDPERRADMLRGAIGELRYRNRCRRRAVDVMFSARPPWMSLCGQCRQSEKSRRRRMRFRSPSRTWGSGNRRRIPLRAAGAP